jgi:hypothetical protein
VLVVAATPKFLVGVVLAVELQGLHTIQLLEALPVELVEPLASQEQMVRLTLP